MGDGSTPQVTIPQLPPLHAMANQAVNFLRAVRGEAPPPCEACEAMEDLRIAARLPPDVDAASMSEQAKGTIVVLATLDTKGVEAHYIRDRSNRRRHAHGDRHGRRR